MTASSGSSYQQPEPAGISLKKKAFGAAGWNLSQTAAQYGFRLISNLIMTRLLMPDAFGLLGFAAIVITALTLFTDIGINQSIVRDKDGADPHYLRVAWTVKIVRSFVISGGVVIAAILIALLEPRFAPPGTVYSDPRLPLLVALTSITTLMQGLESTTKDLAFRNLEYRRYSILTMVAQIMSMVTMIVFALISPTVWALLVGMLSSNVYMCIFTHMFLPGPRMKLAWDKEIANRLWHFGKWIILSSTFTFIQSSADKFLLGALLSATVFGLYVIAQVWVGAVSNIISLMATQVGFPVVSEVMRTRPHDLERVFRRFQLSIDFICIAGFLGLFFGSNILIMLLYTSKYQEAAHYLGLLSVGVLSMRFETFSRLLLNLGNSRALTVVSFLRAAGLCILLPVTNWLWGVDAVVLSVALIPMVSAPYALWKLAPTLGKKQVRLDCLWLIATPAAAIMTFLLYHKW
jgi:O-antigen/teichoic acid export membrane protein